MGETKATPFAPLSVRNFSSNPVSAVFIISFLTTPIITALSLDTTPSAERVSFEAVPEADKTYSAFISYSCRKSVKKSDFRTLRQE